MYKRILVAACLALAAFSTPAQAGLDTDAVRGAGFGNLSEAEKADVIKAIADKNASKAQANAKTIVEAAKEDASAEKVDKWLNVGEKVGKMFGSAAREVGIAVNQFAVSPVGMLTMAIIVWHFMGGVIVHFLGGIAVMLAAACFVRWYTIRRSHTVTTYDPEKTDIFGRSRLVKVDKNAMNDDTSAVVCIFSFLGVAVGLITMFTF